MKLTTENPGEFTKNATSYRFYDQKGFLKKTARVTGKDDTISSSKYSYDKYGIIKRQEVFSRGELQHIKTFENFYDQRGNLIERNSYENDTLTKRAIYNLQY